MGGAPIVTAIQFDCLSWYGSGFKAVKFRKSFGGPASRERRRDWNRLYACLVLRGARPGNRSTLRRFAESCGCRKRNSRGRSKIQGTSCRSRQPPIDDFDAALKGGPSYRSEP